MSKHSVSPKPLKVVIFDMDGTLVDSEPLWKHADETWLAKKGITITEEQWPHFLGKGGSNFIQELIDNNMLTGDAHVLRHEKDAHYIEQAKKLIQAFPEMIKTVEELRLQGLKTALASASSRQIIDVTLKCIGKKDIFDFICSCDSVERCKPDPHIFLHVAEMFSVDCEECLVIEDSRYGVQAACAAGMRVIAVPAHIPSGFHNVFESADMLFQDGMKTYTFDKVMTWLKENNLLI